MSLCFVADENVETEVVDALRDLGHEIIYIGDTASGAEDDAVLQLALERGCILLTNDKDFGELVFQQRKSTAGVVLMRLPGFDPDRKAATVVRTVEVNENKLYGSFVVIGVSATRIREYP